MLTIERLKELSDLLDQARKNNDFYCHKLNNDHKLVPKPKTRLPIGHTFPDGSKIVQKDNNLYLEIQPTKHGRAHLAIDPDSEEIVCLKCGK